MAWNKGAVVIVKHGDPEWANEMEKAVKPSKPYQEEIEELKTENKNLKRDNELSKIHDTKFTNIVIDGLERDYGRNWVPPTWARRIKEGFALIVYLFSIFADKFFIVK